MKANWQTKKLGEVCDIINGSTPLRSNKGFWENGNVPWFTIDDIRDQGRIIKSTKQKITEKALSKNRTLPKETVLLCCTASVGEYAITEIDLTTNQQFNGFVVKNKKILNPFFLFYFSSTLKDQLLSLSGKTTIDFIPISRVKEIEIPLPPLPEQHRIVKILDEAFGKIEKAKENIEKNFKNSKELFESYLENIISDKENKWDKKKLNEVCIVERGSSPRPIQKYLTNSSDGVNWIKIGDTRNIERYLYKTRQKITKKGAEKSRFVKEDDLILSNSMSFGRPYIMKTNGYIHDGWFVLRPNSDLDTEYFYDVISSLPIQNQMQVLASGSVVKNISGDLVKKVILPIPSFSEQKSIVRKLDSLSKQTKKLEAVYEKKLADLEELKKSILNKAFSGEL